jgi:hypothetical protein
LVTDGDSQDAVCTEFTDTFVREWGLRSNLVRKSQSKATDQGA